MRFTVPRPPTGEVSPCGHRPSGGYVACSVHIGVALSCSAGFAFENRLALAVPGCDVPAHGATLRRVRSRNLLDPTASLVLQTRGQKAPTAAPDGAVHSALLRHTYAGQIGSSARSASHGSYVKGFDPDRVETARNVGADLFDPVLASVGVARLQLGNRLLRSGASAGTPLAAYEPLLEHLQPLRLTRSKTRGMQQFTRGQRRRHGHAAVNAYHTAVVRTGNRVGDADERDMPAVGPIPSNPVRLDTVRHRPRQAKSHPPHLGHPHPSGTAVKPLDVMRFHCDLTKPFVHAGFAPRRTAMRAVEQVAHGLREIPQSLLLHRLASGTKPLILGAGLGQLGALFAIVGSLASRLPMPLLLYCQVPHVPRIPAMRQQCLLLLGGRYQPESRHSCTVTTTTDKPCHGGLAPGDEVPLRAEVADFQAKEKS